MNSPTPLLSCRLLATDTMQRLGRSSLWMTLSTSLMALHSAPMHRLCISATRVCRPLCCSTNLIRIGAVSGPVDPKYGHPGTPFNTTGRRYVVASNLRTALTDPEQDGLCLRCQRGRHQSNQQAACIPVARICPGRPQGCGQWVYRDGQRERS